ncbi:hypothetical protein EVAR_38161_1 [Eumeta japonica]|uniref:Uncharacterized protein n=1 Tax=Eumeta variegata TaxID=151549 RepID=A0A4C1ZMD1_EUMVA|nr:hypothetical protein EVAR_38161_1 [Eumeta japonica]
MAVRRSAIVTSQRLGDHIKPLVPDGVAALVTAVAWANAGGLTSESDRLKQKRMGSAFFIERTPKKKTRKRRILKRNPIGSIAEHVVSFDRKSECYVKSFRLLFHHAHAAGAAAVTAGRSATRAADASKVSCCDLSHKSRGTWGGAPENQLQRARRRARANPPRVEVSPRPGPRAPRRGASRGAAVPPQ